jgi:PAS domain S-box-containing protein
MILDASPAFSRRSRRAVGWTVLGSTAAIAVVIWLRLDSLHRLTMTTWRATLEGGAVTTQATIDEWYAERTADAEELAESVGLRARMGGAVSEAATYEQSLVPIERRGRVTGVWVVDHDGVPIAATRPETLYRAERLAVRSAIASGRTAHSDLVPGAVHGTALSIVAPVGPRPASPSSSRVRHRREPAAVVLRTDVVAAFSPFATGRPNAARSLLVSPSESSFVMFAMCPGGRPPICVSEMRQLPAGTLSAIALAAVDSFGAFTAADGEEVLAATRFDRTLGWGIVRRVRRVDAFAPMRKQLALEGTFLAAFLMVGGLAAFAHNRMMRLRQLRERTQASARLATVVDASTDGLVSFDGSFTITLVNSAVERLFGHARDALIGRPVLSLFAPESGVDLAQRLELFARSGAWQGSLSGADRCLARRADGTLFPVDAMLGRATMDGVTVYTMGVHDMSERARSDALLDGQRQVLELIASGAPAPEAIRTLLAVIGVEAPAMRCAAYELHEDGLSLRIVCAPHLSVDLIEATDDMLVGPRSAAVGTAVFRGEAVYSADIATDPLWEDSRSYVLSYGVRAGWAMPLRAADGRTIGALACYCDEARIPTMRELELANAAVHLASIALSSASDAASLRASEASFRSFVENAPAAIFRETRHGHLASANPAMVALLGYADQDALVNAAKRQRLYHDRSAREELLAALEDHDVVRGREVDWRRMDGSLVRVRLSARAYRDDRGKVWLWEGYAEDVTPLRAAEQALRRSEKLAAVGQLISGVAHELNNPLSSILHFAEDLLTDERTPSDAEALGVIREQAARSRAIVRDLLSFVQQREARAEPVRLDQAVASAVRAMEPAVRDTGSRLHLERGDGGAVAMVDRTGLEQVVTNLVSNALYAAGPGGEVWVRTEHDHATCRLVVEDSGPGITADVLPRIFDPFFTTKGTGEGTGLGLSVTLGIVEQFGGRIVAEPRGAGQRGARFVITLPRSRPELPDRRERRPAAPAPTPARSDPLPRGGGAAPPAVTGTGATAKGIRRVLIIDDEASIRTALRRYFLRRGWEVEEAGDGRAALTLIEAQGARFDVIVSDLRMPDFSGIDLHDRLARERPEILRRIVFSTGDVASREAASFVQRTACPVLQKPFELRMLDELVTRLAEGAAV